MSDLIIKPSGTSANFKVQNPSGTNKITMDSDGVTTFASNVSLSGTMTAGTLASGVTFPSGMPTKFQKTTTTISSEQTLTDSFADVTGSSITYTPQTSASYIVYECNFVMSSPDVVNPIWVFRFLVDGTITKNGDSYAPLPADAGAEYSTPRLGHKMIYSASGWTSDKIVKMQARQYQSGTGNSASLHRNHYDTQTSDNSTVGTTDRYTDVEVTIFSVM